MFRYAILSKIRQRDPVKDHQRIVAGVLRLRGIDSGLMRPRRYPRLHSQIRYPSYPDRDIIEELGPRAD